MDPCEEFIDKRVSVRSSFNNSIIEPIDPRTLRNSFEPITSRNIIYHTQLSRNISANNEQPPIQLIRETDNLEHEMVPLQRKRSSVKFKQRDHKKHSCTDVHCLIIFVCFIIGWVYIAGYAFSIGDLSRSLVPTDSNNVKCGLDSGFRNKNKLFFYDLNKCLDIMTPLTGCDTKQVCVESCPDETFIWTNSTKSITEFNALKEKLICDSNIDKNILKTEKDVINAIDNKHCSGWYLRSKSILNHCVWDFSKDLCNILPKAITGRNKRGAHEIHPDNLISISHLTNTIPEFINITKKYCSESSMTEIKDKIEQSKSNLHRIIDTVVSKFDYNDKDLGENISQDLKNSWKIILIAFIGHIFVALLFILLLRWLAGPLLWISICGVIFGLSISFVFSFQQYLHLRGTHRVDNHAINLKAKVENILENDRFWLYTTIVLGAILTIISLIVFVIRKRIKIAVALIKESSKAIIHIKSSIFFPIFPGILYIFVTILSIIIMLHLNSIGENSFKMIQRNVSRTTVSNEECVCIGPESKPYKLGDACEPELFEQYCHLKNDIRKACVYTSCAFSEIVKEPKTQWYMLLNVFGFLWVTFFISAYEDMVLACTFSLWYWTFDKKKIPKLPLLKAMWITTCYHLGTLAFGALILAICRMIRYMLELIEKRVKSVDNVITRAIICCMKCFFWILENFLRFLNHNAYITCAIHSTNFCASSRKAFNLITQNIIRVYAVDRVSTFLFFLSKLLVTSCTSYITYLILTTYPNKFGIHYALVPAVLVGIIGYAMAHFIFSTYSMAVDTLFFCFLEDSLENDGSAEKPYYMSKELCKLLGKSKRKRKQLKK